VEKDRLIKIIETETNEQIKTIKIINQGWDNQVVEINNELIFRFTRRKETQRQHIKELELLPILHKRLTLKVPNPTYSRVKGDPPYYMAYKRIEGEQLTREKANKIDQEYLINTITRLLSELRSTPKSLFKEVPVYTPDSWRSQYQYLYNQIKKKIFPKLPTTTRRTIEETFKTPLNNPDFFNFIPSLIHRDLTSDHIFYANDRITGIIDWGEACYGDPAFDLTGFTIEYENELVEKIIESLDTPDHYLNRSNFYAKVSPFYEILYGIETGDKTRINFGLKKIIS
jgi:aminoglycoside 2''-phosphotransferase